MPLRAPKSSVDMEPQRSEATASFLKHVKREFDSSPNKKLTFSPFFAIDNTGEEGISSQALVTHNIECLKKLLSSESFEEFIGCILFNQSCDELLDTFLRHRSRCCDAPAHPPPSISQSTSLILLDQLIFRLFLRLTSSPEVTEDPSCLSAMAEIAPTLRALRLPRLLSLFALLGGSNTSIAQEIFSNTVKLDSVVLRSECAECAIGTYQTLCELTEQLEVLIVPEVIVNEKLHKVVDLSKSRPKKNTLRAQLAQEGGLKPRGGVLTDEVVDLAEFVMDIAHSLCVWMRAAEPVLSSAISATDRWYSSDSAEGLHMISADGLSVGSTCGVVVACAALLYEHAVPLLERVVTGAASSAKSITGDGGGESDATSRVGTIARTSREMLVQMTKTLFLASSDLSNRGMGDDHGDSCNLDEERDIRVGWDDILGTLLSSGGAVQTLKHLSYSPSSALSSEDVLRIISGGGGLLADVTRAHSTALQPWIDKVFADTEPARRQYLLTVLHEAEGGYLSRDIVLTSPIAVTSNDARKPEGRTAAQTYQQPTATHSGTKPADLDVASQRENIESIRTIFPDYGETFLMALLKAFDHDVDRALDALLSDNLPPTIAQMDRTSSLRIKAAFVGKSSTDAAVSVTKRGSTSAAVSGGKSPKLSYSLDMSKEDRGLQKRKLSALSRRAEQDAMLLQADELDLAPDFVDDYDDQYDDAGRGGDSLADDAAGGGGGGMSSQRNVTSIIVDKKGRPVKPKAPKAVTKGSLRGLGTDGNNDDTAELSERARVLRLNTLVREREVEDAYWAGMQNTNRSDRNRLAHKNKGPRDEEGEACESGDEGDEGEGEGEGSDAGAAGAGATSAGRNGGSGGSSSNTTAKVSGDGSGPKLGGAKQSGSGPKQAGAGGARGGAKGGAAGAAWGKGGGGKGGTGVVPGAKKPKTKTFDKHHQKDKSTRKFGGFS